MPPDAQRQEELSAQASSPLGASGLTAGPLPLDILAHGLERRNLRWQRAWLTLSLELSVCQPIHCVSVAIDQKDARFIGLEFTPRVSDVAAQFLRNGAARWPGADQHIFKGAGGRPLATKSGKRSMPITSELFKIVRVAGQSGSTSYAKSTRTDPSVGIDR